MNMNKMGLDRAAHEEHEQDVWLSGSKASRSGWVRVSDATERVFYHHIGSGKITLERPEEFGDDNPTWADGMHEGVPPQICPINSIAADDVNRCTLIV